MKRLLLSLSALFLLVLAACTTNSTGANDDAVKSPTPTMDDSRSPLNNPAIPPEMKGCGPGGCGSKTTKPAETRAQYALYTVSRWLDSGICDIVVLQAGLTEQERGAFNDMLTAFVHPTSACPVPVIKVEQDYNPNACAVYETGPPDNAGASPATVVVLPEICLLPPSTTATATTQRQGKVDNMCIPYGTSTTRPDKTC